MDKAKAKAKEFGRNLLWRATGVSDSSEEDEGRNPRASKPSYREVVARSPGTAPEQNTKKPDEKGQAINQHKNDNGHGISSGMRRSTSPGKVRSPKRLFSAEDVAKMVELARAQMRKENEASSGWSKHVTKQSISKEIVGKRADRRVPEITGVGVKVLAMQPHRSQEFGLP